MGSVSEDLNHRQERLSDQFLLFSKHFCFIAILFPVLTLFGWAFDIPFLKRGHLALPAMQIVTALGLIIAGLAVLLSRSSDFGRRPPRLTLMLGALIFLFGLGSLEEHFLGWSLGLDRLFLSDDFVPTPSQPYPGRPSLQTAANFFLLGAALLFLCRSRISMYISQACALLIGGNSVLSATGYIFSSQEFYGFPIYDPAAGMAIHTAASFLLLAMALLAGRPTEGMMTLMASDTRSGGVARRILLVCIFAPPLIAVLTRMGLAAGWYDQEAQNSLFGMIFFAVILRITWRATRTAQKSELAEKKLRKELADSEERFRGSIEAAHDAIVAVDRRGKIIFLNHQVEQWFGYKPGELLGQPVEILVPERMWDEHAHIREQFLQKSVTGVLGTRLEICGRCKDGTEFPLDVTLSPSRSADGPIVTAIIRDMTSQKKREGQLRFLARASEVLAESLKSGDIVEEIAGTVVPEIADGCVVRTKPGETFEVAFVAHRNSEKEEKLTMIADKLQHPETMMKDLVEVLSSGKPVMFYDVSPEQMERSFGRDNPLMEEIIALGVHSFAIVPMVVHGKVIGSISFLLDESNRRFKEDDLTFLTGIAGRVALSIENSRLFEELEEALIVREEVLAVVSHDLKNPLAAIELMIQFMQQSRPLESHQTAEFIERIQRSVEQMQRLIGDLLDFSKIQSGGFSVKKHVEQFIDVIEPVLGVIRTQAEAKKQQLAVELPADLPAVSCDAFRISQVLANILGNAVKFTPEEGEITVTAAQEKDLIHVVISDSGPGIATEQLGHIFERFWQAKVEGRAGSGLGLFIARGIVEAHGGRIWAESRFGRGSEFHFTLPVATAATPFKVYKSSASQFVESPEVLAGTCVLVVDDSADMRVLLRKILESSGANVREAASVDEAMCELKQHRPDVVLTDIEMQGKSGFDLLNEIHHLKKAEGGDTPVAAVTAYERERDLRKIEEAGFDMHLVKPVSISAAVSAVKKLKAKSRLWH